MLIGQGALGLFVGQRAQCFQSAEGMDAGFGSFAIGAERFQNGQGFGVLPLQEQSMSREPVPSVRIGQLLDKFRGTGRAQVRFQIALPQRMVGNDSIDLPERIALEEIDLPANLFRNRFRRLDHLPVNVGEVQIAVRRVHEITRAEPYVRGGQKFHALFGAMGREGRAAGADNIAMNQIGADVPGEHVADVLLREGIAVVQRTARCGREPAR